MDAIQEAKRLFNETWDLLDKTDRTEDENASMLHKAHASCLLWKSAGTPLNEARGEWQVSRVYSVLGFGEPALLHGKRSLRLCQDNQIVDFDLAFAFEGVARAYLATGDAEKVAKYKQLAIEACEGISDAGDKEYALSVINQLN